MSTHTPHTNLVLQFLQLMMKEGTEKGPATELAVHLYVPRPTLRSHVERLRAFADGKLALTKKERGDLLEQVAALCFQGLVEAPLPLSLRLPDWQVDVLQFGATTGTWMALAWLLEFPPGRRNIVAECKCYESKPAKTKAKGAADGERVAQREYARLAGIMHTSMSDMVGLGVMFSLWGGSGADTLAPSDSRLFRIKHHARYHVPIIDITLSEVEADCLRSGGFIDLLMRKVRELGLLSTVQLEDPADPDIATRWSDTLPDHLKLVLVPKS